VHLRLAGRRHRKGSNAVQSAYWPSPAAEEGHLAAANAAVDDEGHSAFQPLRTRAGHSYYHTVLGRKMSLQTGTAKAALEMLT